MIFSDTKEWTIESPKETPFRDYTTERIWKITTMIIRRVNDYIQQTGNTRNKITISPEIYAVVQSTFLMNPILKHGTETQSDYVGYLNGTIPVYVDYNLDPELFYVETIEETDYKPMAGRFIGIKELEGELLNGKVHSSEW